MHCKNFISPPLSRRTMLSQCGIGFGAVALHALLGDRAFADEATKPAVVSPFAPKKPHYAAKAKSVIFLYMDGGVSQVDSFDPSPFSTKKTASRSK